MTIEDRVAVLEAELASLRSLVALRLGTVASAADSEPAVIVDEAEYQNQFQQGMNRSNPYPAQIGTQGVNVQRNT